MDQGVCSWFLSFPLNRTIVLSVLFCKTNIRSRSTCREEAIRWIAHPVVKPGAIRRVHKRIDDSGWHQLPATSSSKMAYNKVLICVMLYFAMLAVFSKCDFVPGNGKSSQSQYAGPVEGMNHNRLLQNSRNRREQSLPVSTSLVPVSRLTVNMRAL